MNIPFGDSLREIEEIRGVNVDGVVSTLLERHLIRIVARKDVPGKPFLYGTTREFLEAFNLKDLKGLPTLQEMEEMTQGLGQSDAGDDSSGEEGEDATDTGSDGHDFVENQEPQLSEKRQLD